ncbi:MAG: DNA/RNA nuclease SfsA [candidate division KSB1 bacterium]|nr:DNA/RNA nuclease SfsA [candidate division KSB1 bacterium]
MKFPQPLIPAKLRQRYQRFLADVELADGTITIAHCPNSGSMRSCNAPGSDIQLSYHPAPHRKYAYTWEMIRVNSIWVGINTLIPNRLIPESITSGKILELQGYEKIQREPSVGPGTRLDLRLQQADASCYVEIKNVTLVENEVALFPDAVTLRGQKHLLALIDLHRQGHRSVVVFLIQRQDAQLFAPADEIDPEYGRLLRLAADAGVEILPYRAVVTPEEIYLDQRLPIGWHKF